MSLRLLTPLLAMTAAGLLPAADRPEGDRPAGPPPGALFERFDQDGDHLLSQPEFVRGMIALQRQRAGGDQERPPRPAGEGEGRPARPPGDAEGRPARPPGDGEGRPARPPGDGEGRPARPPGDGEGRPARPPGDGEGRPPRGPGDGEGRPRAEGGGPLEAAFAKADADQSGKLTLDEFRAALQNAPRPPGQRPPGQGDADGGRDRPRPPREN